jgi:hypothetical protein
MKNNAYWITKTGKIIEPDSRHILTIVKHPELFGETDKSIKNTFDKYNEHPLSNVEGEARNEVMLRVIKRGYIRIRLGGSRMNQKFSIQLNKLTPKVEDVLWMWARVVTDKKQVLDKYSDVIIHELNGNKMTRTSLDKIASGGSIKECISPNKTLNFIDTHIYKENELLELYKTDKIIGKYLITEGFYENS